MLSERENKKNITDELLTRMKFQRFLACTAMLDFLLLCQHSEHTPSEMQQQVWKG
jgi:hypothetical protein